MKSMILVPLLVVFLLGCAEQGTIEQTSRQTTTQICNIDLSWYSTSHIGFFDAKRGYFFAVVTVRVVNHSTIQVDANPFDWEIEANNVTFMPHTATFDDSINYSDAKVGQNGDLTFQLVFEIPNDTTQISLHYTGFSSPLFVRDDSLIP